jgi:hypothetical protein
MATEVQEVLPAATQELTASAVQEPALEESVPMTIPQPVSTAVEIAPAEVATASIQTHIRHRSRLKQWKKKLHLLAAELTSRAQERTATITESIQMGIDRVAVASLQSPVPEIAERKPKKIDWEQPEDDIPSMAEAAQALELDGIQPEFVAMRSQQFRLR